MDGIESDLEDRAELLRLSITDNVGRELAIRYSVRSVPTLLLLDGSGNVVLKQTGRLDREAVRNAVGEVID